MTSTPTIHGKFVQGSTMRHVINMTATGSIGLIAVFLVDVLNLLYISQLGKPELAAAIGYASTLLFFHTSIAIGLSIATTATVSRAIGSGDNELARQFAGTSLILIAVISVFLTIITYPLLDSLLTLLGAQSETALLAKRFCQLVLPSIPLISVGMGLSALLRALGDGKGAMYVTLGAAFATAILDPLFIFSLNLGLDGAAFANVLARLVLVSIGAYSIFLSHRFYSKPKPAVFRRGAKAFATIGIPAILTNVATPVGNAAVTSMIAKYGDQAVAGWAVVSRLIPMAFAGLFALSGAVGPILGQNLGAKRFDRLRSTMRDSLKLTLIYVLIVWFLLAIFSHLIARAFDAQGVAADVIVFFCVFVAGSFLFNGSLFVANAAFNNLGYPLYSTMLNWGRSTLGVIPFVWFGGLWFGARGVIAGYGLGVVLFGIASVYLCFRVLGKLEQQALNH
ncbi:MATE family efflux transporter [Undibacterium macrobrachii]|jgi:putative MATE family efflux protein|uniref:MATE family efflux transporter n=1 Tax=Undibacterium macrobrachii TaxID=1119058 RepID=A0ABQ2XB10_9BURK|nr:MATE family efflux transporter [Undibacterium macrobrachii]GGX07830.1 MATE family efflux transporter [Undibacterium macrobrachii]